MEGAGEDILFPSGNSYCAICLKTSNEAALVYKDAKDFFEAMQVNQTSPWLCVWCLAKLRHFQDVRTRVRRSQCLLNAAMCRAYTDHTNATYYKAELNEIQKEKYIVSRLPDFILHDEELESADSTKMINPRSRSELRIDSKVESMRMRKKSLRNKNKLSEKDVKATSSRVKAEVTLKLEPLEENELSGKIKAVYQEEALDELYIDGELDKQTVVRDLKEGSNVLENVQFKDDPLQSGDDSWDSWVLPVHAPTKDESMSIVETSIETMDETGIKVIKKRRKTKNVAKKFKSKLESGTVNALERANALRRDINEGKKEVTLSETDDMQYVTADVVRANVTAATLTAEQERRAHAQRLARPKYANMKYRCELCATGSVSRHLHERHMRKHSPSRGEHRCVLCETHHPTRAALAAHAARHRRAFRCRACGASLPTLQHAANHYFTRHAGIRFRCAHCDSGYRSLVYLKKHLSTHNKADRQQLSTCDICKKVYDTSTPDSKYRFNSHVRSHEEGKLTFECPVCDKVVVASRRSNHMKVHAEAVLCTVCLKTFRCRDTLQQHIDRIHTRSKRYQCDTCGKLFFGKSDVRTHIEWTHMRLGGVTCSVCGMTFRKKYILVQHTRKVHENKPKPKDKLCDICGRGFAQRSIMEQHRLIHTGAKPHKCEQCGQTFRQKTAMNTHVKLKHLNVKWSDMMAGRRQRKCAEKVLSG